MHEYCRTYIEKSFGRNREQELAGDFFPDGKGGQQVIPDRIEGIKEWNKQKS